MGRFDRVVDIAALSDSSNTMTTNVVKEEDAGDNIVNEVLNIDEFISYFVSLQKEMGINDEETYDMIAKFVEESTGKKPLEDPLNPPQTIGIMYDKSLPLGQLAEQCKFVEK